jgi:hypothetical protein
MARHLFKVKATEHVSSEYLVKADNYTEAEAMVSDMRRLHDGLGGGDIEQIDYQAFQVEVEGSELVEAK